MCGCQDQSYMCKHICALNMIIDKQFQHLKDLFPIVDDPHYNNIDIPVEDPRIPKTSISNAEELQQPLAIKQSPRI